MPLLAKLIAFIGSSLFTLIAGFVGAQMAARITAALSLAALYVSAVAAFTAFVQPLLANVFSTQYGQLLGLLFPPVAGTIIAGLVAMWGMFVTYRYVSTLTKMAVG